MNGNSRIAVLATAVFALSGCTTRAILSIHSEPEGAYIVGPNGRNLGTAPVTVAFDFGDDVNRCFEASGYEAHWSSGAVTELAPVELCRTGYYDSWIQRDLRQPGLQVDMGVAMDLQMIRAQEDRARAERYAADAALQEAYARREAAEANRRLARQLEQERREREDRREQQARHEREERREQQAGHERDDRREQQTNRAEQDAAEAARRLARQREQANRAEQDAAQAATRSARQREQANRAERDSAEAVRRLSRQHESSEVQEQQRREQGAAETARRSARQQGQEQEQRRERPAAAADAQPKPPAPTPAEQSTDEHRRDRGERKRDDRSAD